MVEKHTNTKNIRKYTVTGLLGSGKIVASAALLQLGLQGSLLLICKDDKLIRWVCVSAAFSNAITNAITRYPAIYKKFFQPKDPPEVLTRSQDKIAGFFKAMGRASAVFIFFNTQDAIQKLLRYYSADIESKDEYVWSRDWPYAIPALIVSAQAIEDAEADRVGDNYSESPKNSY